jgi:hypothetical protein
VPIEEEEEKEKERIRRRRNERDRTKNVYWSSCIKFPLFLSDFNET